MRVDPITLEILGRKFAAITDEVYLTVQRTARSSFVNEVLDFAVGLLDLDGNLFGYPPSATFNFLIDTNFKTTIDAAGPLQPGDVIITNDPYTSGGLSTHLPDVHLIQPLYVDGKLVAYGWAFAHCLDFGGSVHGSVSAFLTEIHQEGLRIPPMKYRKAGVVNDDLLALIRLNTRMPDVTIADFGAMMGALSLGERRLKEVAERFGADVMVAAQGALQDYAAERARAILRKIPDGVYEFWDYMDDDAVSNLPIRVRLKLTVDDGAIHMDLTGTDPATNSAFNVPSLGMRMYWLTFRLTGILTTYDKDIPRNAGLYRSITVENPEGSVLNAEAPTAVSMRHSVPYRLFDSVTGAILKATPDLMSAATGGSMAPISFSEPLADGTRRIEFLLPLRSGMGAFKGLDGVDGRDSSVNNMRNRPLETIEGVNAIRVLEYDIRCDSGGPGEWRGGVAQQLTFEVLCESALITVGALDRRKLPPWGVAGGKPGATVVGLINRGREDERAALKGRAMELRKGETLTLLMAGGGGFGDPLARPVEKVIEDVKQGFVSEKGAEDDYGVVIRDGAFNAGQTDALRLARKRNSLPDFDFGPDRELWETIFDDESMRRFNELLYRLPKSMRYAARQRVFHKAVPELETAPASQKFGATVTDAEGARARFLAALDELSAAAAA